MTAQQGPRQQGSPRSMPNTESWDRGSYGNVGLRDILGSGDTGHHLGQAKVAKCAASGQEANARADHPQTVGVGGCGMSLPKSS